MKANNLQLLMESREAPNNEVREWLLQASKGISLERTVIDKTDGRLKIYYGFKRDRPRQREALRKKINRILRRFDIEWIQGEDQRGKYYELNVKYYVDSES